MLRKLFGGGKIRVELIEAISNERFGSVRLSPEQLPASFDKPTTMHIEGDDWMVEKAEPLSAREYLKTGKLVLWVKKVLKMDPGAIRYSIPTISDELPAMSADRVFYDFELTIDEDDWRQMEFFPQTALPRVQQEMSLVEAILFPEDDPGFDSLNGFEKMHVRKISRKQVSISLNEFFDLAGVVQKGSLSIRGYAGYVQNGFAFRSADHIYYGTVEGDRIVELCLADFDSIDEEINRVISSCQLLLVCWCRGTISSG